MTTAYHDDLLSSPREHANAATFNAVFGQFDQALVDLHTQTDPAISPSGVLLAGVVGTNQLNDGAATLAKLDAAARLKLMGRGGFHPTSGVTYDSTWPNLLTAANGTWDDGSAGAYSA